MRSYIYRYVFIEVKVERCRPTFYRDSIKIRTLDIPILSTLPNLLLILSALEPDPELDPYQQSLDLRKRKRSPFSKPCQLEGRNNLLVSIHFLHIKVIINFLIGMIQ